MDKYKVDSHFQDVVRKDYILIQIFGFAWFNLIEGASLWSISVLNNYVFLSSSLTCRFGSASTSILQYGHMFWKGLQDLKFTV